MLGMEKPRTFPFNPLEKWLGKIFSIKIPGDFLKTYNSYTFIFLVII